MVPEVGGRITLHLESATKGRQSKELPAEKIV